MKNIKNLNIPDCLSELYEVEFLVFRNFITVIKNKKWYILFRGIVGTHSNNVVSLLYQAVTLLPRFKRNIFYETSDIVEVLNKLVLCVGDGFGAEIEDELELQKHIGNCVNTLLHYFIEPHINDFNTLSKIGEEIFNLTCENIFGDDFVDLTDQLIDKEKIDEIKKSMEKYNEFGELPWITSIEDVISTRAVSDYEEEIPFDFF